MAATGTVDVVKMAGGASELCIRVRKKGGFQWLLNTARRLVPDALHWDRSSTGIFTRNHLWGLQRMVPRREKHPVSCVDKIIWHQGSKVRIGKLVEDHGEGRMIEITTGYNQGTSRVQLIVYKSFFTVAQLCSSSSLCTSKKMMMSSKMFDYSYAKIGVHVLFTCNTGTITVWKIKRKWCYGSQRHLLLCCCVVELESLLLKRLPSVVFSWAPLYTPQRVFTDNFGLKNPTTTTTGFSHSK